MPIYQINTHIDTHSAPIKKNAVSPEILRCDKNLLSTNYLGICSKLINVAKKEALLVYHLPEFLTMETCISQYMRTKHQHPSVLRNSLIYHKDEIPSIFALRLVNP